MEEKAQVAITEEHHYSGKDAWYPASKRDAFIVKQLVTKDFKLKYRRSVLGIAWSVLNPLLMMLVQVVVFTRLMVRVDASIPNFPIYLILGNTAWSLMSTATSTGMNSIIAASGLLKKVRINRWVFPVEKVLFALVNYVFSMAAVALVMVVFRWMPSIYLLYLPLGLLYLTVFCIGLSMILASLAVFFRDVIHLWSVVLTAWLYLTPIFYSVQILPDWMQTLEKFNPMYLYITFIRRILLWRSDPGLACHLGCIFFALISLGIGYLVFRKHEDRFILFI